MKKTPFSRATTWSFSALSMLMLGALTLTSTGCQKYVAIPDSASDRIWMVTQDGTEVFRCWDLKNQTGKLVAICRRAEHVGKTESTRLTEFAESTNPPPHPDSTEICAHPASRDAAHR